MSKTLFKKITTLSMCALLSFSSILPSVQATYAFAEGTSAVGTIEADLEAMSFNTAAQNAKTEIEVISVQEHYYSEDSAKAKDYSLYIYIYTPAKTALQTAEGVNTVNMAIAYNDLNAPSSYKNISLTYIDNDDDYRYYKFKVSSEDSRQLYDTAKKYASRNKGKRRYDIAGVQLKKATGDSYTDEITKANDIQYGKTYYFTGYETGYGVEGSVPLGGTYDNLETIALSVNDTYWRGDFNEETNICDTINTVYFSVPDEYFEVYGALQRIKAEWWEYKTKPIFATSDAGAYSALYSYIGKEIGEKDETLRWTVGWDGKAGAAAKYNFSKCFNKIIDSKWGANGAVLTHDFHFEQAESLAQLDWLFFNENIQTSDFIVEKQEIVDYLSWYKKSHALTDTVTTGRGEKQSKNLFLDTIDEDRAYLLENSKMYGEAGNYIQQEIDAGDKLDLFFQSNSSWDEFWHGAEYATKKIEPIIKVESIPTNMTVTEFAKKYYINENDADEVFSYCKEKLSQNEIPILFRFAVTDYYASTAYFDYIDNSFFSEVDGVVAQQTMFFNFDIISISFKSFDNGFTVIPAVADPIDITPPITGPDKWQGGNNTGTENGIGEGNIFGTISNIISMLFLLVFIGLIIYVISRFFSGGASMARAVNSAMGDNGSKKSEINKANTVTQTGTATPQNTSAKNAKSKTTNIYLLSSVKSNYKNTKKDSASKKSNKKVTKKKK